MNVNRLKAIAKLGLLFGIPLSLVLGLFSTGVYVGAQHRHTITTFERDWLRLDVEVPDPPPEAVEDGQAEDGEADRTPPGQGASKPADPAVAPEPDERARPQPQPEPPKPSASDERLDARDTAEEARADPLQGELAHRFSVPITAQIKVLVDPALAERHPQWIDYVQRTLAEANRTYQKQFGIVLELVAVGLWPVATEGMSRTELLADLERRPREGADILLGFTDLPLDATARPSGVDPSSPFNGAYSVVHASGDADALAHVRSTLREVGRLFGAHDILDADDPGWEAGSWMSHARVPSTQAPWIDGENRRRILERKDKPFAPESQE